MAFERAHESLGLAVACVRPGPFDGPQHGMRTGSSHRVVDRLPENHQIFMQDFPEIIGFLDELRRLCDDYFASQEKNRATNYEDVAYATPSRLTAASVATSLQGRR